MRLFCGIPLSPSLREVLAVLPSTVGMQGFRLTPPAKLHITLRFYGEVDDTAPRLTDIKRACTGVAPFDVEIGGGGIFGDARRPHVAWVGVHDATGSLVKLATALGGAAERPYHPHVTLGRAKRGARVDVDALRALPVFGTLRVDVVTLFHSIHERYDVVDVVHI
jgi:2'-5' RNA ligase